MLKRNVGVLAVAALALVLALPAGTAGAGEAGAGAPGVVSYQGYLTDEGRPLDGADAADLRFGIYAAEVGTAALWEEIHTDVDFSDGYFAVLLGSVTPLGADVLDGTERWLQVSVDLGSGYTDLPRQRIAAAPYALQAQEAASVPWSGIIGKPATFPPSSHAHDDRYYTETELGSSGSGGQVHWDNLVGVPEGFADGVDAGIPAGVILMWHGSVDNIPDGWALCDGSNGTPDLRDRFVVGAGDSYAPGDTGGEAEHTLTTSEIPTHTHTISSGGSHRHAVTGATWLSGGSGNFGITGATGSSANTGYAGTHNHGGVTGAAGKSHPHENRPPYYALVFIIKLDD